MAILFSTCAMIAAAGCSRGARTDGDADSGLGVDAAAVDAATVPDAAMPVVVLDFAEPQVDVDVVITADNAYSFGYGDDTGITTYIQGTRAVTAGEIFNCPIGTGPEHYVVPAASAPPDAFLYVVSWDDLSVTQGVLGQFKRGGTPLYTGDPVFQVCATGIDLSQSTVGPTKDEVNAQIAICNGGTGGMSTTSAGWVNGTGAVTTGAVGLLATGEDNSDAGGDFPITCSSATTAGGIDPAAHWMWYSPPGFVGDAFRATGSNTFRAYLIFRVASTSITIQ